MPGSVMSERQLDVVDLAEAYLDFRSSIRGCAMTNKNLDHIKDSRIADAPI
jgi:hypothetical protein